MSKKKEEVKNTFDLGPKQLEIFKKFKEDMQRLNEAAIQIREKEELMVLSTLEALKVSGVKHYYIDFEKGQLKVDFQETK